MAFLFLRFRISFDYIPEDIGRTREQHFASRTKDAGKCWTLEVSCYINIQTTIYCLKKLAILLHAQQLYRDVEKCNILKLDIYQTYNDAFDKEYCMSKILKAGNEYGMLALEAKFQKKLKKNIMSAD